MNRNTTLYGDQYTFVDPKNLNGTEIRPERLVEICVQEELQFFNITLGRAETPVISRSSRKSWLKLHVTQYCYLQEKTLSILTMLLMVNMFLKNIPDAVQRKNVPS